MICYVRRDNNGTMHVREVARTDYPPQPREVGPFIATNKAHALRIAERLFDEATPRQQRERARRGSLVERLVRQHRELTTAQAAGRFGLSESRIREIRRIT